MKPIIGSHYAGPQLDRALRRMPPYWQLDTGPKRMSADRLVLLTSLAILAFGLLSACGAFA